MIRWWQRRSLRFRLAMWYALGGCVLLAIFSGTLYLYVARWIARPLDEQLRADLATIERQLAVQPDGHLRWNGRPLAPGAAWPAGNPWFELWDDRGHLVGRFWPFTDDRTTQLPPAPPAARETISVFEVTPDLRLRTLSVPYAATGQSGLWMLRVIRVHEPVGDTLGALRLIIVLTLPAVVTALVIGGYSITRRWLRPLHEMADEATRITALDLGRRLPVANPHDELGRLATGFNITLDRLESSFRALDRFVADASHELRTPLTTLRSVGEVGLRRSRTPEQYRDIIASMLEEAQRLGLLVERLLELASTEGGAAVLHRTEFRLDDCVRQCVGEFAILAETKQQQLTVDAPPCPIVTDEMIVRQALQNLVHNAIKHCPDATTIRVALRDRGERVEILVADNGPGISAGGRANLMERFYRPDRSRHRSQGGFGLGLSITRAYARVLGGTLEYESLTPHGSAFRLFVPKSATTD